MANTENINVETTKEVIDAAVQAVEAIPVKPNAKFGVIGMVVVGGAAIITGIGLAVRHIKNKQKAKESDVTVVDNVQVAKDDFEECDSTEE